jgi:hypothetical protein
VVPARQQEACADRDDCRRDCRIVLGQVEEVRQLVAVGDDVVDGEQFGPGQYRLQIVPVAGVLISLGVKEDEVPRLVGACGEDRGGVRVAEIDDARQPRENDRAVAWWSEKMRSRWND